MSLFSRSSGILLPVFSLPSRGEIGGFGAEAYRFVDFLRAAGQSYWQVLPLNPTAFGDSPYFSPSAFAGNPYFIDFDLTTPAAHNSQIINGNGGGAQRIDYAALYQTRPAVFKKAFQAFQGGEAFQAFQQENADWLPDYCLFMALKDENPETLWQQWDEKIKYREPSALAECRKSLKTAVEYHAFLQYQFQRQWGALKAYANQNGIKIIGDIPIYVAADSADMWANPGLFQLDADFRPARVAGCPPDGFCADGQTWGNPLYDWRVHAKTGYQWWISRIARNLKLFDVLRIDHFRGLESFFAIPANEKTAARGVWERGPGKAFIKVVNEWFDSPPIIAENLGFLTSAADELLEYSGYPGMRVLQFGFSKPDGKSEHLPHRYVKRCVAYSGTHDNDTARGYLNAAQKPERRAAKAYLGIHDPKSAGLDFARAVLNSAADLAIIPMQDYLNFSSGARINIPSTLGGNNWRWRLNEQDLTHKLAKKMREMAELAGRA